MSKQTHIEGTVEFLKHTAEYEGIKSQLIITGARNRAIWDPKVR